MGPIEELFLKEKAKAKNYILKRISGLSVIDGDILADADDIFGEAIKKLIKEFEPRLTELDLVKRLYRNMKWGILALKKRRYDEARDSAYSDLGIANVPLHPPSFWLQRSYLDKNKEKIREQRKAYRDTHREEIRSKDRERQREMRVDPIKRLKLLETKKRYREKHKEEWKNDPTRRAKHREYLRNWRKKVELNK